MALIKVIGIGDELVFDLAKIAEEAKKEIRIMLCEKAGRMGVFKITADRSIPINHIRQVRMSGAYPTK